MAPPPLPATELVWSVRKTLLWSVMIAAVHTAAQLFAALIVGVGFAATGRAEDLDPETLGSNGLVLALLTWFALPFVLAACFGFARMKRGLPAFHYLGLVWSPFRRWWYWSIVLVVFIAAADLVVHLLDRPVVPEFMHDIHETAGFLPLLWATVLIAAPLGEEVLFRGFIYRGLEYSPLRWPGATVITALLWAVIHFQYDWLGITYIFFSGLLLGTVRHLTGSIVPCMLLHFLMNLIAMIQLLFVL